MSAEKWRYVMNLEKLTELRDYLLLVPEEKFDYSSFFRQENGLCLDIIPALQTHCFTTACVAGHAAVLFAEELEITRAFEDGNKFTNVLGGLLGLRWSQRYFLFYDRAEIANKSDAIRRLTHLIEGKRVKEYNWSQESHLERRNER